MQANSELDKLLRQFPDKGCKYSPKCRECTVQPDCFYELPKFMRDQIADYFDAHGRVPAGYQMTMPQQTQGSVWDALMSVPPFPYVLDSKGKFVGRTR